MLGNVAYNCEVGHQLILKEGAVGLAMAVLDEHMESEMVVRAALIMLWKVRKKEKEIRMPRLPNAWCGQEGRKASGI